MAEKKWNISEYLILGAIIIMAFALRIWGIDFGLPHYLARPDEDTLMYITHKMFSGDLNPHFFHYPTAFIYLLYFLFHIFFLLGKLGGLFNSFTDYWIMFANDPSLIYLIPRLVSVTTSLLTIVALFNVGRKYSSSETGLLAAFWAAGTFLLAREAHFGVTDTTVTLLCLLAIYYSLKIYETGTLLDFIFAAIISGLATSVKYTGALLVFPLVFSSLLCFNREKQLRGFYKDKRLWLMISIGIFTFFAFSPYILIDFKIFYEQFFGFTVKKMFEVEKSAINVPYGYWHHLRFTLRYGLGLPLLLLALGTLLLRVKRRQPNDLIVLSFIIGFFLIIGRGKLSFVRYIIPIVPLLLVIAADGLNDLISFLTKNNTKLKFVIMWLAGFLIILPSLISLISFNQLITKKDTRIMAREWIEKNVPAGSVIAYDGSMYNKLSLLRSPSQMEEYLDQFAPGIFQKEIQGNFANVFTPQWYTQHYVSDYYLRSREVYSQLKLTPKEAQNYFYQEINKLNLEILVTSGYTYLPDHSYNQLRLNPVFVGNGKFKLIKRITPYNPDSKVTPLFDQLDAFFVPYNGFSAVKHPGPEINIFQLNNTIQ